LNAEFVNNREYCGSGLARDGGLKTTNVG